MIVITLWICPLKKALDFGAARFQTAYSGEDGERHV